ncbi:MAG: SRPBCC family protein [Burkholderiales bacterium]|nr:SRPBCC family protein [Burkholderiales bacterium]
MQIAHSIVVEAAPERVFRLYADVARWHTWDPDTREARLDGPFAVGTRGSLTPTRGNTVPMVITELVPDVCFTVECRIPLFTMRFEHLLQPAGAMVHVTHRATFSGALAPLLGRLLARRLDAGLPVTLASLKRHAEGAH